MSDDATRLLVDDTAVAVKALDDTAVAVEDLFVSYGPVPAVRGVSFTARRGTIVGVIGRNGAGKSTLLRCVAGLEPAVSGRVFVDGEDLTSLRTEDRVAHGVALVPEGRSIFRKLSIRENLLMGAYHRKPSRAALEEDIHGVTEHFPQLRDRLSERAGSLSGGQQQMLAIGRALMAKPRVLLVDEPSLGLAPKVVLDVYGLLAGMSGGEMTVVVVEQHVQMLLDHASELCVLDKGEVVMRGSASELRASNGLLAAYLGEDSVPTTDDPASAKRG